MYQCFQPANLLIHCIHKARPDFSNWKNHDAFEHAFARLEEDLRASIGK